ncbi:MAG: M14 family metallopeptidase [Candidatus Aminicenantes bacterium]|nr:M14 family metallopeptidase [Candidatus Aminicenantes bacterium]
MKHPRRFLPLFAVLILVSNLGAQTTFDRYHTPAEFNAAFRDFARANAAFAKIHELAKSPGGREVVLLEIGPEVGKTEKKLPAVFIGANFEGSVPLAGEAALFLVTRLAEKLEVRKDLTWYVLGCPNPDAAFRYFAKPLRLDPGNDRPWNDDMDDAIDEDGPEDLDGNGLITTMRVKDPEGVWVPVPGQPRLMKRADWAKGEKGIYKLVSEGLDNDKDGAYNEDPPGGVNIGVQFPHLFGYFAPGSGSWPGSEAESFAILKFVNEHKEIGLSIVFGGSNFCLNPPRGGRRGDADLNQIRVPKDMAGFINADPDRTYTMAELLELVKPVVPPGMPVDESMIASFLGLGAAVNPLPEDLKFYKELSDKYKEFLKTNKLDAKRLEPAADKDGSFELYAYYQLGVPSFALDFWTLPEVPEEKKESEITPEKLEKMTNDEFIALGEEKIDAFLKSSGAPAEFKAKQVIETLKGGQTTTKQMAEMMKQMPKPPSEEGSDPREKALLAWSDKELEGKGFVDWKPFKHPALGEVEIGGAVPFADSTPPPARMEPLLQGQIPWVFEIAAKMARIQIGPVKATPLGGGLYEIEAWIEDAGYFPYPTAMGRRNNRIIPVVVTLEGKGVEFIEGKQRSTVPAVDGNGRQKVRWIVQAPKPVKIEIKAVTPNAWRDSKTLDLGGGK